MKLNRGRRNLIHMIYNSAFKLCAEVILMNGNGHSKRTFGAKTVPNALDYIAIFRASILKPRQASLPP